MWTLELQATSISACTRIKDEKQNWGNEASDGEDDKQH